MWNIRGGSEAGLPQAGTRCRTWLRRAKVPRESGGAGAVPSAVRVAKLGLGSSHGLQGALRAFTSALRPVCPQGPSAEAEGACAPWEPHPAPPGTRQ